MGDGETLYGICFKLYGNVNHVEDICALNGMTDMNHVAAGQKLDSSGRRACSGGDEGSGGKIGVTAAVQILQFAAWEQKI